MTQNVRNDRSQARRRVWLAAGKWLVALALLAVVGVYAFQSGARYAKTDFAEQLGEMETLREEASRLGQENESLRATVANARTQAKREAQQRIQQLEEALAAQMEQGLDLAQQLEGSDAAAVSNELFRFVQEKLDEGVAPDQIVAAVSGIGAQEQPAGQPSELEPLPEPEPEPEPATAQSPDRICDREPRTKRFQVQVPNNPGEGQNRITFENGRLRVTATGQSYVSQSGRVRYYYDPAQPITVLFTHRGGFEGAVTGVLPITHELVIAGVPERFVIEENERGFIQVTGGRCRFR